MGLRVLILLFIALPFVIYGKITPNKFVNEVAVLDEYAKNETMIANNTLILTENGFLGEGSLGFVYAGQLAENNHPVAIKFIPISNSDAAQNEYEILKHMQADTNPEVESFGIPTLYHYGEWESFILIALTRLDESLDDIVKRRFMSPLEIMILFKDFVIQSKYMHTHEVYHGDVHPDNIMFRSNQSFIINFDRAKIMEKERAHFLTHAEWIHFICSILDLFNIGIPGYWDNYKRRLRKCITDKALYKVIKKFGDEAFSAEQNFPNYDGLEKFIKKKIENHGGATGSRLMCSCFSKN